MAHSDCRGRDDRRTPGPSVCSEVCLLIENRRVQSGPGLEHPSPRQKTGQLASVLQGWVGSWSSAPSAAVVDLGGPAASKRSSRAPLPVPTGLGPREPACVGMSLEPLLLQKGLQGLQSRGPQSLPLGGGSWAVLPPPLTPEVCSHPLHAPSVQDGSKRC